MDQHLKSWIMNNIDDIDSQLQASIAGDPNGLWMYRIQGPMLEEPFYISSRDWPKFKEKLLFDKDFNSLIK